MVVICEWGGGDGEMAPVETELEDQLREAGQRLLQPPLPPNELLPLLDQVENGLSRVEQSPSDSMQNALRPLVKALISEELFRHSDMDVKVAVACCISEITRITAPDAPYEDGLMKEIFQMIVSSFEKLHDMSSPSYSKRVAILETVAKVRSCVVMLDLDCDDLILEMFNHFLKAIRENHPNNIFSSMETIMTLVLEESEDISLELLSSLLSSVKKENQDTLPVARRLGEKVIGNCAAKIKPYLMQEVKSKGISLDDYSKVVASIYEETFDAQVKSNFNASVQDFVDEKKLSEATGTDEHPQGVDKMEPEVACRGEVDKSPTAIMSNGIVQSGDYSSLQPHSPEKKPDHSHPVQPLDMSVAMTEGEPVLLNNCKMIKPESLQDHATKKKRAKKPNSTHSTDHSKMEREKEAVEPPSRKGVRSKGTYNSVSEVKETTRPSEDGKKTRLSSPIGSPAVTASAASPTPSQSLSDSTHHKKGRPTKKKEVANAEVSLCDSSPVQNDVQSEDEAQQSKDVKLKESDGCSDSDVKAWKHSGKKVHGRSADLEKLPSIDSNLKKETKGTDLEAKPLRRSGKQVPVGNASESQTLAKQKGELKQKPKGSDMEAERELSKKKMVSFPKSARRTPVKDESHSEETPKVESKRKRVPMTKMASEKFNDVEDLDENIVGRKIKVWWPDDHVYYYGVVDSFDPVSKKHKILYVDDDKEILLLKEEKWEFIGGSPEEDEKIPNPDTSEMLPKKKLKTGSDSSSKQVKMDTPFKRSRGSADRSKGEGTKMADNANDDSSKSRSKSKSDTVKLGSRSQESTHKSGSKTKDGTGSKHEDDSPKIANKSKKGTPKTGLKSKDSTGSKSRDDSLTTPKTASKAKGTTKIGTKSVDDKPKTSSKANGASMKQESGLLKAKISKDSSKGKLGSTMMQGTQAKSGKKKRKAQL